MLLKTAPQGHVSPKHNASFLSVLHAADVNFASELSDLRHRHGFQVILVHKSQASSALLQHAHLRAAFEEFVSDLPLGMVVKSQVSRHTSLSLSLSLTLTDLMNAENCWLVFQFGDRAVCVYVIVKLTPRSESYGPEAELQHHLRSPRVLFVCLLLSPVSAFCLYTTSPRTATPKRWPTVCSGSPLTVEGRCWACRAAAPCCGSPAPRQPSAPASAWRTKTCWATASRCPSLRTARRRKRSAGPLPPPLRSCLWRSHAHPGACVRLVPATPLSAPIATPPRAAL